MEFIQNRDFNSKNHPIIVSKGSNLTPSVASPQFFRHPAFLMSSNMILGFFIQEYFHFPLKMILILIGTGFFGEILLYKYSRWFFLASCLFWVMLAGLVHYLTYQVPINTFRLVQETKVTYQGTIQCMNEKYYLSKIESFSGYRPILLLKNQEQDFDQFLFQRVEVTGIYRPFVACSNPGSVNLQTYWRRKRIFGEIQVYECRLINPNTFWNTMLFNLEQKRKALTQQWRKTLGEEYPYFTAMLWGEKDENFQQSTILLQETGIYHTFCVSCLHLTILGGILLFLLQKIRCPKPLAVGISIFFCLLYLLFCSICPSAF